MGDLGRNFGVCEADADTLTSAGEEQRMLVNVVCKEYNGSLAVDVRRRGIS